jgi:hypothetical protein
MLWSASDTQGRSIFYEHRLNSLHPRPAVTFQQQQQSIFGECRLGCNAPVLIILAHQLMPSTSRRWLCEQSAATVASVRPLPFSATAVYVGIQN